MVESIEHAFGYKVCGVSRSEEDVTWICALPEGHDGECTCD